MPRGGVTVPRGGVKVPRGGVTVPRTALGVALQHRATADPDRIAVDPVTSAAVTYAELWPKVAQVADRLRASHELAVPMVLELDHGCEAVITELALLEAGIPVLSLPPFFSAAQSRHARKLCAAPFQLPAQTARISFTSGSTGTPRGICLSAPHLLDVANAVVAAVGAQHAGRHLALLPPGILLETVAGFYATLLAGGSYVCPPQAAIGLAQPFRPDFAMMAQAIEQMRISSLILVPEYLAGLVAVMQATGLRLPALTIVAVGGARTAPTLIGQARALGLPVRQGYGLTELGSVVALEAPGGMDGTGSVGQALGHVRARIGSDGEVLLDGPLYLGAISESGPATPPIAPFSTGDIGRIDDAGRLWIEGRKSNLLVTGFGRNVSPEWVEEALLAQPGVLQAMVWGDGLPALRALLVPGRPDVDFAEVVAAANATLPAYARIGEWREVAPFTPDNGMLSGNGKLRRQAILAAWTRDVPIFSDELDAATFRERLRFLTIPQVRAGLTGAITHDMYLAYLAQAWHHVRHTVPLMQAARDRIRRGPKMTAALDDYIAEERGHDEWILSDIAAAGGDAEAVRRSAPAPATAAMIAHAYHHVRACNPVSYFGMIYVLESVSVALAQRGASAVAERLGLPSEAFTYLTSHGALDADHLLFFADTVNGLADPGDRAAIITMAREMFGLFGSVFAGIPLEEIQIAA